MEENIDELKLSYYKIYDDVKTPIFSTEGSACFDVFAYLKGTDICGVKVYDEENEEYIALIADLKGTDSYNNDLSEFNEDSLNLKPFHKYVVPTGLIFNIPIDYSIRGHIRSSIALKKGIMLVNSEAIIDSDYYHELYILLMNSSELSVSIVNGEKIAQFELVPTLQYTISETNDIPKKTTSRKGGLGSTGENK